MTLLKVIHNVLWRQKLLAKTDVGVIEQLKKVKIIVGSYLHRHILLIFYNSHFFIMFVNPLTSSSDCVTGVLHSGHCGCGMLTMVRSTRV